MNHWVLDSDRISFKTDPTKLYDQLHTLHMGGIPLSNWWQWEGCSFSQLKELVLSRNFMNFEGTLQIVAAASNLQLLEFHELEELVADSTTLEPALKLDQGFKVLRMRQVSFEALFQELKWVVPGAWETELIVDPESFPHDSPSAPLFPNGSTVTTLSLINKTGDYPSLVIQAILKAFPNVQTLTLDGFNLTRSILSAITRSPNVVEGQFPRLSVLRLHSSRLFDYDTFMAMVMSHPIRRLEIWHSELQWNIETRAYAPVELSPLYPWLRERVPEIYIVGPYIET
ncbi:hypothetical protein OPQ81_006478 [Rhizoctonia solani]|nr:hypothetical protein OPQ81_006478 [Rhizoctonia solani]